MSQIILIKIAITLNKYRIKFKNKWINSIVNSLAVMMPKIYKKILIIRIHLSQTKILSNF